MKIKFDILFRVQILHDYFKDTKIPGLVIRPSAETLQTFKNYGLRFKPTSDGLQVYYEVDTTEPLEPPLKPLTTDEKFVFELYYPDSYFVNYTQLPLNFQSPNVLYFNNILNNVSDSQLLINKNTKVNNDDVVNLNSEIFTIQRQTTQVNSLLEVRDVNNNIVFSKTLLNHMNQDSTGFTTIYQIKFDEIGEGRYDIYYEGALLKKIYAHSALSRKPLLGIIEIFKSADVNAAYVFANATGAVSNKTYALHFENRRATWMYHVILKNTESIDTPGISYGAKVEGEEPYPDTVNFLPQTADAQLVDKYGTGRVLTYESDTEIPIYQVAKKKIDLTSGSGDSAVTLLPNLSNAPVSVIKTNELNTLTYSEIYVYV